MVRIEIFSAQQTGPVAVVEANQDSCRIDGSHAGLIDPRETMLGLPSGRRVTAQDAPEEWARGLIIRYRSPDLSARIVHDDEPLTADAPPIRVREPAHSC